MEAIPAYLSGFLVILLFTAFVKIVTTLSILRYGLGLGGAGFGAVILGLSLALAMLVSAPELEKAGGLNALFQGKLAGEGAAMEATFRPFLEKHADPNLVERFSRLRHRLDQKAAGQPAEAAAKGHEAEAKAEKKVTALPVLLSAFLVSELKSAFQLGFLFIIPFIVIDLMLANALMALGVTQISQKVVALPLKLILFFVVDGWGLISEKLMATYL